jgi:hypothetical protein
MTPERTPPPRLTLAELEQWYRRVHPQGWWSTAWNTVTGSKVAPYEQDNWNGNIALVILLVAMTLGCVVVILSGHAYLLDSVLLHPHPAPGWILN